MALVADLCLIHVVQKCDTSNSGTLEGSEIKEFYNLLTQREEINVIYEKCAQTEGLMSARDLLNFLLNEQREQVTIEHAQKLIENYEVDAAGKTKEKESSEKVFDFCSALILCVFAPLCPHSETEEMHDQRWLLDVPPAGGVVHL